MKKNIYWQFLVLLILSIIHVELVAQNVVVSDDNAYSAQTSAMLDVKSLNKGFLVPRLTTAQMNAISSPAAGLLIFNTTLQGFCYYSGTSWINISSQTLAANTSINDPLFKIINAAGDTVFAVYPEGVRIKVGDGIAKGSGNKGGFAVGGFGTGKVISQEYLRITKDSVRIYVNPTPPKGSGNKGGFAVGGFGTGKVLSENFLHLTPKNYFIGHQSGKNMNLGVYNSFMGYQAGMNNTDGSYNSFIGYQSGYSNKTGYYDAFYGYMSGNKNTTGSGNVFTGYNAGFGNTKGHENVYVGAFAGETDSSGFYNVYIGYCAARLANQGSSVASSANYRNVIIGGQSGYYIKGSSSSTFVGYSTGFYNTTGLRNTFLGCEAGQGNVDGSDNIFVGSSSGQLHTNGGMNVFLGSSSGYSQLTGANNAYMGYAAGYSMTTGYSNIFIGSYAGYLKTNGMGNIFMGYEAGYVATALSDYNVSIGYQAGYSAVGDGNVFIGKQAGYSEAGGNRLYIENSNAASTSALIYGEFDNDRLAFNASVGIGVIAPVNKLDVEGATVIGANYSGTNTAPANGLLVEGSVGIGVTSLTRKFEVNGNMRLGVNGTTIANVIKATINLNLASIAASGTLSQNFTVANAAVGSTVYISPSGNIGELIICNVRVSTTNTVTVMFKNTSTGAIDLAAMDWYITVIE